jgi:pimeloyl-ACP methyl ester carboxylesterase
MKQTLVYSKAKTKSGEIGYVKVGDGKKPLVMITRYAATLYNWDSDLVFELSKYFTVYLFDWRMVGHSNSNNSQDINGCVSDIHDAIVALHIYRPLMLGWSFGGVVAQEYYKAYPDNVSGMILLSTFPDPRIASDEFVELAMGTDKALDDNEKAKLYQLLVSEIAHPDRPNLLKHNTLNIVNYHFRYANAAKELHNKFVLTSPGLGASELSQIKVPCLILNAKNDLSFPPIGREMFIQNIPNSKLIVYPRGGHLLIHHNGFNVALDIINYFI